MATVATTHGWMSPSIPMQCSFARSSRRESIINGDSRNSWQHKRQLAVHANPSGARTKHLQFRRPIVRSTQSTICVLYFYRMLSIDYVCAHVNHNGGLNCTKPGAPTDVGDSYDLHIKTNTAWKRLVFARISAVAQQESFHAPVGLHCQPSCRIY